MRPPGRIALDGGLLRRWTPADAPALHTAVLESFELLHPWMSWAAERPEPTDQEELIAAAIRRWEDGEAYLYGVFDPAGEQLRGSMGLHARVGPGAFDIGYWLHAEHIGKGLATRAAGALTETGLALPGIERIEIHCDEANTASAAIPKRLGFHLDRIEDDIPEAPASTGRRMIWIKYGS
ncbi:GNAT family N-acetyltransferase [Spirillospora sp. NPDC048911]|uniref:GNAT family N-acetyltransferase n=1 Tax=Spirillospora sp. NPDC048911 TaxID=3364527 RepID=UPI003716BE45